MSAQILTPSFACSGCQCFQKVQGEMTCINLIHWHGGTPPNPPCYQIEDLPTPTMARGKSRAKQEIDAAALCLHSMKGESL